MHTFFITAPRERPDFRQVIAFLWHDDQNVDTDGNAHHPASRTWTELYVQNRENRNELVEVIQFLESPLILRIESEQWTLAAQLAFYLASHCGGSVGSKPEALNDSPDRLLAFLGADFDEAAALRRAAQSPFSRSSIENPYPNLDTENMLKRRRL